MSKYIVIIVLAVFSFGCTTTYQVADGFPVQGSVTHTVDSSVPGRVVSTEELHYTAEAAKYKLDLAKLEAKVRMKEAEARIEAATVQAQAVNPCAGRSWVMAPVQCYGGPNRTWDGGVAYLSGTFRPVGMTYYTGTTIRTGDGRHHPPPPPPPPPGGGTGGAH